jgi:hypothetical protein
LGLGFTRFGGREEEKGACSSSVRRRENGSHQREPSTELALAIGSAGELGEPKPYQRRMTGEEEEGLCLIFALFVLGGFSTENFESK